WLQTHRVELNAMPTWQFLGWLDAKVASHRGKVIPPAGVMADRLARGVEESLREIITERVLTEAGVDELVDRAMGARSGLIGAAAGTLVGEVTEALAEAPQDPWSAPVGRIAGTIARAEP